VIIPRKILRENTICLCAQIIPRKDNHHKIKMSFGPPEIFIYFILLFFFLKNNIIPINPRSSDLIGMMLFFKRIPHVPSLLENNLQQRHLVKGHE
jgi:hypothetical protein